MIVCSLLGVVPFFLLVNIDYENLPHDGVMYTLSFFTGSFMVVYGSMQNAILMNVNPASVRSTLFALTTLFFYSEKGLGPLIVSIISAKYGRMISFNICLMFVPLGCLFMSGWIWTLPYDIERANVSSPRAYDKLPVRSSVVPHPTQEMLVN